jgi:hypothetical protein
LLLSTTPLYLYAKAEERLPFQFTACCLSRFQSGGGGEREKKKEARRPFHESSSCRCQFKARYFRAVSIFVVSASLGWQQQEGQQDQEE